MNKNKCSIPESIIKKFEHEAEDGGFLHDRSDDGTPFALGATDTGNLFSIPIIETPDPLSDGSIYVIDEEHLN
jgi:hypothetical protein